MEREEEKLEASAGRLRTLRAVAGGVAALTLAALVLVGCSAGGGGTVAVDEAGDSAESAAVEDGESAESEDGRDLVIEGAMTVVVDEVDAAVAATGVVVASAGGRIDGREEWNETTSEGTYATAVMTLRIPAAALDAALDDVRALGTVESLTTSSLDVTGAVQDIDAHVRGLESTIARLTSFQDQAASVPDLLSIEKEIAERQTELEGYLARQADYAERVDYSTITLTLQTMPVEAAAPETFWSGLSVGWNSFTGFLAGLAVVLGVLLPWLVAAGALTVGIVFLVRWLSRRRAKRRPPVEPAPVWLDPEAPRPEQPVGAGWPPQAP